MKSQPLDELYFKWLYEQIGNPRLRNPSRTHWGLARQLFTKEFVWFIPNDDNRVEDGRELRYEFLDLYSDVDPGSDWMGLGCSMLEMLIGLSRRLAFETEQTAHEWFWQLLENLGIDHCSDQVYNDLIRREVDYILDRVIWRTYSRDGRGGLFPLQSPREDQRKVEIWYQLNAYLIPDI